MLRASRATYPLERSSTVHALAFSWSLVGILPVRGPSLAIRTSTLLLALAGRLRLPASGSAKVARLIGFLVDPVLLAAGTHAPFEEQGAVQYAGELGTATGQVGMLLLAHDSMLERVVNRCVREA